jgi:hypothetical protein
VFAEFGSDGASEDDVAFGSGCWGYVVEVAVDFGQGASNVESAFEHFDVLALESDDFGPAEAGVSHDDDESSVTVGYGVGDPVDFCGGDEARQLLRGRHWGADAGDWVVPDEAVASGAAEYLVEEVFNSP